MQEAEIPPAVALIVASILDPPQHAGPVQASASMGSPLLQRRLLRDLGGKPALSQLIERLRLCRVPARVVLAASIAPEDDGLVALGRSGGVEVFRGSVNDQAGRLRSCIDSLGLPDEAALARVMGDAIFADPGYLDAGLLLLRRSRAGAVEFEEDQAEELCPGTGCGFLRASTLRHIDRRAHRPAHRGDVMRYIYDHPDEVGLLRCPLPDHLSHLRGSHRLLLQTAEDLALHEAIYLRLYQGVPIDAGRVISFLNGDPVMASLNRGVLRRTASRWQQAGWRAR